MQSVRSHRSPSALSGSTSFRHVSHLWFRLAGGGPLSLEGGCIGTLLWENRYKGLYREQIGTPSLVKASGYVGCRLQ